MIPFLTASNTNYPSNIFYENELKEIPDYNKTHTPLWRTPLQKDISETLPEINSRSSSSRPFNYRLGYRSAVGTRGHSNKLLYGSSLLVNSLAKKDDLTDFELLEDVRTLDLSVVQKTIFDVDELLPDQLRSISKLPYVVSVVKKVSPKKEHKMSPRSRAKVKDKIFSLYRANLKSHFFMTLTFVNKVSDTDAISVLNKFFTVLRQDYGKFNYIWVAERQNGKKNDYEHCTGNIHFHILLDKRFPVQEINSLWVLQQYNSGIEHPKYCRETVDFFRQYDSLGTLLNPLDVDKINGINGLSSYLTKYVTKNEDSFACRVWHCSRTISKLFTSVHISRSTFSSVACAVKNVFFSQKTRKTYTFKTIVTEHAIVHTIVNKRAYLPYMGFLEHINERLLKGRLSVDVSSLVFDEHDSINLSIN